MALRHPIALKSLSVLFVLASGLWHPAAIAAAEAFNGVTGLVFFDKNGDGVRQRDEPGFAGIVVVLFGKKFDHSALYLTTRTDSEGRFAFPALLIGDGSTFTVSTGGAPLAAVIPTTYHPARTFYTATNGNDANPGSLERPFRTIGHAAALLQAGDLLYIRQGEYRQYISSVGRPLGGGSDWDHPIIVAGMPGETVVVRPTDREDSDALITLALPKQQYLVFDNLVLDAEDATLPLKSLSIDGKESPHHIRLINCELKNSKGSAVFVAGEDHQFINCRIHDNGHSANDHGLYISGGHNLIQGCDIYHSYGRGIQLNGGSANSASNNVIRGNRVHDNGHSSEGFGIGLEAGQKNLVYDNVIWANFVGIVVTDRGCEELICNNTVCGNRHGGIAIAADQEMRDGAEVMPTHDNKVRNNIAIGNGDPNLARGSKSTVYDHNMVYGNPLFRDPKANDFHLKPGSGAIDTGAPIEEVLSDHDGISRPQGKGYDLGAYEYSDDSFVPTRDNYSNVFRSGHAFPVHIGFTKKAKK